MIIPPPATAANFNSTRRDPATNPKDVDPVKPAAPIAMMLPRRGSALPGPSDRYLHFAAELGRFVDGFENGDDLQAVCVGHW